MQLVPADYRRSDFINKMKTRCSWRTKKRHLITLGIAVWLAGTSLEIFALAKPGSDEAPEKPTTDEMQPGAFEGTLALAGLDGNVTDLLRRNAWDEFNPLMSAKYQSNITQRYFLNYIDEAGFKILEVHVAKIRGFDHAGYMIVAFRVQKGAEVRSGVDVLFLTKDHDQRWRVENFPFLDEGGLEFGASIPEAFFTRK